MKDRNTDRIQNTAQVYVIANLTHVLLKVPYHATHACVTHKPRKAHTGKLAVALQRIYLAKYIGRILKLLYAALLNATIGTFSTGNVVTGHSTTFFASTPMSTPTLSKPASARTCFAVRLERL